MESVKLGVDFAEEGKLRKFTGATGVFISIVAAVMSLYHLSTAVLGTPEWVVHRPLHVVFFMLIGFFTYKGSRRDTPLKYVIDIVLALLAVGVYAYIMINYDRIANYLFMVDKLNAFDYIIAVILIFLVLEMTRRTTGWALIIVALLFVTQTLFAKYFPGFLRGASVSWKTYLAYMLFTSDGIYGSTVNISASYVFLFVLFGTFLEDTGVGSYFINIASNLTSGLRGGSAKAAILASGFFGSISGSAVANVYATGTFTIPMMKKSGFKNHFAGAVEAVASSGGAIVPPVMGSAAFLMADFLGVPYSDIAIAAFIPAILYYISLWFMIDKEAIKLGMKKNIINNRVSGIDFIKESYKMLPIITIIIFILKGYTAFIAAFYAIIVTIFVGFINDKKTIRPKHIFNTLVKAGKSSVTIAAPLTCAAIVVGSIQLTGVGLKLTSMIVKLAGGELIIALFLTMIITIILGMGLPTPAAYLLVAIFAPSALSSFGVEPLVAHLFCFYYAAFSTITPPVAMAAYAAGNIAGAPINKTGFTAMKIGVAAYIIPWIFVFSNSLLMQGPAIGVIQATVTGIIGIYALSSGVQGYFGEMKITVILRTILLIAALCLIVSETLTDIIGIGIVALIYFYVRSLAKGKMVVG